MISIYKYINSEDVRDHLRNINYSFNPAECAYIVGISKVVAFSSKKVAYEEIINTTPDCLVGNKSLHDFLKERLKDEEDPIKDVFKSEEFEQFFSVLPLSFPLPFKKGDMLINRTVRIPTIFVFSGEYEIYYATNNLPLSGYITGYNYEDFGAIMTSFHRALDCERYTLKKTEYAFPKDEREDATLFLLSAYMKEGITEEEFRDKYKQLALKITEAELDEFFAK